MRIIARQQKPTQHGYSIVELVLSIVIGTMFIIITNQIVNNYVYLGQKSRNVVLANSYVEGKIEDLRNSGYNSLNLATTDLTSELPSQLVGPKNASVTISSLQTGIKKIVISVTYNDQGISRTYSYSTYVGELGVGT